MEHISCLEACTVLRLHVFTYFMKHAVCIESMWCSTFPTCFQCKGIITLHLHTQNFRLSSPYGCSTEADFCSCNHIQVRRLQLKTSKATNGWDQMYSTCVWKVSLLHLTTNTKTILKREPLTFYCLLYECHFQVWCHTIHWCHSMCTIESPHMIKGSGFLAWYFSVIYCKKVLVILTIVWSPQLQSVCVCVTHEVQEVLIIQIRVWLRSFKSVHT